MLTPGCAKAGVSGAREVLPRTAMEAVISVAFRRPQSIIPHTKVESYWHRSARTQQSRNKSHIFIELLKDDSVTAVLSPVLNKGPVDGLTSFSLHMYNRTIPSCIISVAEDELFMIITAFAYKFPSFDVAMAGTGAFTFHVQRAYSHLKSGLMFTDSSPAISQLRSCSLVNCPNSTVLSGRAFSTPP